MLRPERMSKVSVTGSKAVMEEVIEAVHDLRLVHLSEYDGSWEGFDHGTPVEGSDETSTTLVTVRALESILDVEGDEVETAPIGENFEAELEDIRQEVNELDDRRDELQGELRELDERIDAVEPFARLGIDLDLLSGYDRLQIVVGEGDEEAVSEALAGNDDLEAFETFAEEGVVAAAAYPAEGAPDDALSEALVGVPFSQVEIPEASDDATGPDEHVAELRSRREEIEAKLEAVEDELETLREEHAGFLLAVEEKLSIEAQKQEAPLSFATTRRAFVAEGWVPSDRYDELEAEVVDAVGDRIEIEELMQVSHEEYAREHAHHGDEHEEEDVAQRADAARTESADEPETDEAEAEPAEEEPAEPPRATDGSGETGGSSSSSGSHGTAAAGGGAAAAGAGGGATVTMGDEPPVMLNNPKGTDPFEVLIETYSLPRYDEFDPTILIFLALPAFFGFMIGDVGYGILYMAIGYWMWTGFDSKGIKALGGVGIWVGVFTFIFGILYGELFGLHELGYWVWGPDGPPLTKGLMPANVEWARLWIAGTVVLGILHLTVAWLLGLRKDMAAHGFKEAFLENGSWIMLLLGVWTWIFSFAAADFKPGMIVGSESVFAWTIGFTGFPAEVGWAALIIGIVGLVLLGFGEGIAGVAESLQVLVHALSYTRITAVLLGKAGMAFVVNLLAFGAFAEQTDTGNAFVFMNNPLGAESPGGTDEVIFGGLYQGLGASPEAILGAIAAIAVFIVGHLIVLGLGVTSAGIQGLRLHYVEFFVKFYEGGGEEYEPFGYERQYTADD